LSKPWQAGAPGLASLPAPAPPEYSQNIKTLTLHLPEPDGHARICKPV